MERLLCFVFLCVLGIGAAIPPQDGTERQVRTRNRAEWEQLVMRTVEKFKPGRVFVEGLEDETAHIQDIQSYYREIFDNEEGWVYATGPAQTETVVSQSLDGVDQNIRLRRKKIDGRYIINLESGSTDRTLDRMVYVLKQASSATKNVLRADHIETFRHAGKGFTGTLNKNMIELVLSHPSVENVEEDVAVQMKFFDHGESRNYLQNDNQRYVTKRQSSFEEETLITDDLSIVPWNLDRLDQHSNILDGQYNPEGTGKGVDVFIIDTGTRYTHEDLEGRVKYFGVDMIDKLTGSQLKGSDCNGHGTHVAGTIGGKTYGVAKQVSMYSVRGLDCSGKGSVSGVVQLMDLIAKYETPNRKVMSLSLGIEASIALNTALKKMVNEHGIVAVAAAGNQGSDSCKYSPASSGITISVGATDSRDEITSFSNTGSCVHLFAPGREIVSASKECDSCTKTMSGTSMACPHVTGYVAILLEKDASLTPAQVLQSAIDKSTKDAIGLDYMALKNTATTTPNRLLYVPGLETVDVDL